MCGFFLGLDFIENFYSNLPDYFFSFDVILLSPIALFLFLNEPHDCFVCHGKDPDRIYSSYQLTWEERTARKMVAMYGGTISAKRKALQEQSSQQPLNIEQLREVRNDRRDTEYLHLPLGAEPKLIKQNSRTMSQYEKLV